MPRTKVDYNKTIMYRLCCNDLNITYQHVGYTTDFSSRKNAHKAACNNENDKRYNQKIHKIIRDNGGWNNWDMVFISSYPCREGYEAKNKERELFEYFNKPKSF